MSDLEKARREIDRRNAVQMRGVALENRIFKRLIEQGEQPKDSNTPETDFHAFHRISGISSPAGDVVGVDFARALEIRLQLCEEKRVLLARESERV